MTTAVFLKIFIGDDTGYNDTNDANAENADGSCVYGSLLSFDIDNVGELKDEDYDDDDADNNDTNAITVSP